MILYAAFDFLEADSKYALEYCSVSLNAELSTTEISLTKDNGIVTSATDTGQQNLLFDKILAERKCNTYSPVAPSPPP